MAVGGKATLVRFFSRAGWRQRGVFFDFLQLNPAETILKKSLQYCKRSLPCYLEFQQIERRRCNAAKRFFNDANRGK